MYFFLSAMFLLVSCGQRPPAEDYGFITRLGQDTIAIESVTRQGNTLTSNEVDRFPRVRIRHTVIKLNNDGSIRHLVMDIHTPSEPSNERDRKVIADVTNKEVHISKTDATGTIHRAFTTGGAIVVAHVPQMYSLYELYFVAALSTPQHQSPMTRCRCGSFILTGSSTGFRWAMPVYVRSRVARWRLRTTGCLVLVKR